MNSMNSSIRAFVLAPLLLFCASACAQRDVIPQRLEDRLDRDLRFAEVQRQPDAYRGKLMLVGGKVMSVKPVKDGTRIELLEMPLSPDLLPDVTRQGANSRFVVMDLDKKISDPAVLENNELITIVGEVLGSDIVTIDEHTQQVPKFAIRHVTVWERDSLLPFHGYTVPTPSGYGRYTFGQDLSR
jgi:outer membrane lipoprotein